MIKKTDDQRKGNTPYRKGSECIIDDIGTMIKSDVYETDFGIGETVVIQGKEICVHADFIIKGTTFWMYGLIKPQLKIHNASRRYYSVGSETDPPKRLAEIIKKYSKSPELKSHIGKLFLERVPECLDFSFEKYMEKSR